MKKLITLTIGIIFTLIPLTEITAQSKVAHINTQELISEMKDRGFTPDPDRKFPVNIFKDNGLYNDWMPTLEDYKIIRQRIQEKIDMKPDWYRKTKK